MKRITNFAILLVYILFSISLGIFIAYFSSPECFRNECINKSSVLLQTMDMSFDPCEDFYRFVCGDPEMALNDSKSTSTSQKNFSYILTKDIRDIKTRSLFSEIEERAQYYWEAAAGNVRKLMDNNYLERLMFSISRILSSGTPPTIAKHEMGFYMTEASLRNITRDGRSMSIYNMFLKSKWIDDFSLGYFEFNTREVGFPGGAYTTFHLGRDRDDRDSIAPYFGLAGVMPFTYNDLSKNKAAWNFSMPYLWTRFTGDNSHDGDHVNDMYNSLHQACAVWFKVMTLREQSKRKPVGSLRKISLEGLERLFSNKFDFKGFLLRGVPPGHEVPQYAYLSDGTSKYFAGLAKIFKRFTKFELACYMVLYNFMSIIPHLQVTNQYTHLVAYYDLQVSFNQFLIEFYYSKLHGLILSNAIERFHIRRPGSEILHEIFHYLNETMEEALLKTPWMDAKTKRFAIKKLYLMKALLSVTKENYESIGVESRIRYYTGYCVGESDLDTFANTLRFFLKRNLELYSRKITGFDDTFTQVITPRYEYEKNELVIPVLMLTFPGFENAWPRSVNYGTIGIEMAHFISEAFDFRSSEYNELGFKLEKPWWTNETIRRFKLKEIDCSFSSRVWKEIRKEKHLTKEDIRRGSLLSPQWRLITAIKLAFEAYSKQRDDSWVRETSLPGLESFSPSQIFFMSYANAYCYPQDLAELVNNRALFKTISEMEIFQDSFNCKRYKDTSTSQKCMMW